MGRGSRSSSIGNVNCIAALEQLYSKEPQSHEYSAESTKEYERSVEELLLEAGTWALFAIRIPGYFPLIIRKRDTGRRTLEVKPLTLPMVYAVLVSTLSVCGSSYFLFSYCMRILFATAEQLKCFENTIIVLWTTFTGLVVYTTYLRCSRFFYIRSSLLFWRSMVTLVENLVEKGYSLNGVYLRNIYRRAFVFTLLYHVASLVRIVYNIYDIYTTFKDPCSSSLEIVATYMDLFISFTLCYHVGYSVWLTFLISVLTMCVKMMHDDLEQQETNLQGFVCEMPKRCTDEKDERKRSFTPSFSFLFGMDSRDNSNYVRDEIATVDESKAVEQAIHKTLTSYELIEVQMHKFNAQFGVTLILETFFIFLYIVTSIYCVESFFKNNFFYALVQLIPVGIFSVAFFNLASASSVLSGMSTGTLKRLEAFFIPTGRPHLKVLQLKILSLIARVADNPPTISAAHFFNMNRHLLTSFVGTVTTYLVVLLQYRDPPPTGQTVYCPNSTCPANETKTW